MPSRTRAPRRGNTAAGSAGYSAAGALRLRLLRAAGSLLPAGSAATPTGEAPRKVLLIRPDHVGDVLLTAPAIALLRQCLPHAEITYLVGPWSREVAEHGPLVDRLWTLEFPGFTRRARSNVLEPYALLLREAARLRRERFEVAVMFRPDHWWGALLAACAGVPVRVGGATPETQPLLTRTRAALPAEHAADQALALARLALYPANGVGNEPMPTAPLFRVSTAARDAAAALWREYRLDSRSVVAVQPSAGAVLKSWPHAHWAAVADALIRDGHAVLLTGAPSDRPLLLDVAAQIDGERPPIVAGQSLDATAAVFERCQLLIGLDGGAAHLAAAVGTPTVRLYGPASPVFFGPWPAAQRDQRVLLTDSLDCVPCGHLEAPPCGARTLPACLQAIDPTSVIAIARQQLSRS